MERQLNNPLRPNLNPLRADAETNNPSYQSPPNLSTEQSIIETSQVSPKRANPVSSEPPLSNSQTILRPEIRKALDALNAPDDLRKLMAQLAEQGIEIAGPRKIYIKHSYEIDQDLHQRFHEMYPVLGFKKVKDAINDALSNWCDQNQIEFRRRCGPKK